MNYKFNTKIRLLLVFVSLFSILFLGCEQKNNSTEPEIHERIISQYKAENPDRPWTFNK